MENKNTNPNTPAYNFINEIIDRKNNEIKENILLGRINFPKHIFYDIKELNKFQTDEHQEFLNNLLATSQLLKVREEKKFLENKVKMTDNKILVIKQNNTKNEIKNRYELDSLENINSKNINYKSSQNEDYNKNKIKNNKQNKSNQKSLNVLPKIKEAKTKRVLQMEIKPIINKRYISYSKVNNHEMEEKLEADAKNFIYRINSKKGNYLTEKKKKEKKEFIKIQKEIELMEQKKKLREEEDRKKKIEQILKNKEKSMMRRQKDNISNKNFPKKKYHYYDPNQKIMYMIKNYSNELKDFSSQLYYNNFGPDLYQYEYLNLPEVLSTEKIGENFDNNNNNYRVDGNNLQYYYVNDGQIIYDNSNNNIINNINNTQNTQEDEENINKNELNLPEQYSGIYPDVKNMNSYINDTNNNANNSVSLLDTSDKKSLYYFNDPKYESEIIKQYPEKNRPKNQRK